MPIPHESCPPGTAPDVCCDTMFLIGDRLRTVACDAVMACADPACGTEFRSYFTHGERIQDPIGDSLIVSLRSAQPATTTTTANGRIGPTPLTRMIFQLELRENGWPTASADGTHIKVADPAHVHSATAHSMSHAEAMYAAIMNGVSTWIGADAMFPINRNPHIIKDSVAVGQLLPVGPDAHQVAWSVEFQIDARLRKGTP